MSKDAIKALHNAMRAHDTDYARGYALGVVATLGTLGFCVEFGEGDMIDDIDLTRLNYEILGKDYGLR